MPPPLKPFVPTMKTETPVSRNSLRGRPANGAAPGPGNRLFLLLTSNQWLLAFVVGAVAALVFWPYYRYVSPWIGAAVFLVGVTIVHLRYAARFIIPFPHVAILITALQYVLAAWASAYYPHYNPNYNIGSRLPEYLPFATLVLLAGAAGWGLGMIKLRIPDRAKLAATPELLNTLDVLLVIGFLGVLVGRYTRETGLGFIFLLVANLRYLAVYGRMVCQRPGWGWRLALVMVAEVLFASSNAMFHGVILWGFWTFALWIFVFKPSWRIILTACAAALLLLPALQESKLELREQFGEEEFEGMVGNTDSRSSVDNATLWLSYMGESFKKTLTGNLDEEFIGGMLVRYNQGWIINRVMLVVPEVEPYARGATLKDALISALVPRLFYPDKVKTGGQLYMQKYAGVQLNEGTSMNLGYAGEMYANFGYWGGIVGCGFYCLAFALLFRAVCVRAFASPLWWAVMPYIGFSALKAEDGIVGVVNWTSKACLLLIGVCFFFPAFRRALFLPQTINQKPESRNQKGELRRRGRVRRAAAVRVRVEG